MESRVLAGENRPAGHTANPPMSEAELMGRLQKFLRKLRKKAQRVAQRAAEDSCGKTVEVASSYGEVMSLADNETLEDLDLRIRELDDYNRTAGVNASRSRGLLSTDAK